MCASALHFVLSIKPYGILFLQIGFKEMVYVGCMMPYACKSKGHATADIFRRLNAYV